MDTGNTTSAATDSRTLDLRDKPQTSPLPEPKHPTRREDGRTPNPRAADRALAADLNLPVDSVMLFDSPDAPDSKKP